MPSTDTAPRKEIDPGSMETQQRLDLLYVGMLPPHPGGSGLSWAQLLSGFASRQHRVRSLAPITEVHQQRGDSFAAAHPELGVERFTVPHYYTGPNIPASDEYIAHEGFCIREQLSKMIRLRRPDLLIIGRETFAHHVPDIAIAHGIPCIQGIRGNTAIALVNRNYPQDHAGRLLAQFRKVDLLVSAARHMAEGLRGMGFTNVIVIANAVDPEQFALVRADHDLPQELEVEPEDIVVTHLSNLKAAKRPLDLVAAADLALRSNPRLLFMVVGDGAFREAMERECRVRRIDARFRFVGWVEHHRIPVFLNRADMVVSMSETEGLSRAYLESQAAGRLLIASDIPPAREVIEDGVTGIIFRRADAGDLAAKILLAAAQPELRRKIGVQAREQVSRYPLRRAVEDYLDLFARCVRRQQEPLRT